MKPGDVIDGKYTLIKLIGEGGMGQVFEAEHLVIKRRLAFKTLHTTLASNSQALDRFIHEAQAAAAIGSSHIIEVTDGGRTADGAPYLVMELLDGDDLAHLLAREGKLDPARAANLIIQAAKGLGAAHRADIIHRDLKPENLFVTHDDDGAEWVKVLDFGIAKFQDLRLTPTDVTMGTPYYMAPEQAEGAKKVDRRSDVYSLGAILYQLLTGRRPFQGDDLREVMAQILFHEAPPPRQVNPSLSEELEGVVLRAMAREREARYQSMEELIEALGPHAGSARPLPQTVANAGAVSRSDLDEPRGQEPSGPVATTLRPVAQELGPAPRRTNLALVVGLGLLALGGVVGVGLWGLTRGGPTEGPVEPRASSAPADPGAAGQSAGSADAALGSASPSEGPATSPAEAAPESLFAEDGWVRIEPGSFAMGSPETEAGRYENETRHEVTISHPYQLKATEVTQGEWRWLMKSHPSGFGACGESCPVESVNWYDALAFCNALSRSAGLEECYDLSACAAGAGEHLSCRHVAWPRGLDCRGYRLPTEAEWERAARAGKTTATFRGDLAPDALGCEMGHPLLEPVAWFCGNAQKRTHPVRRKAPSPWGLYDIHGNVWEWVWDLSGEYPTNPMRDPLGPPSGANRVIRGGGFNSPVRQCRAAIRGSRRPTFVARSVGLRPARSL